MSNLNPTNEESLDSILSTCSGREPSQWLWQGLFKKCLRPLIRFCVIICLANGVAHAHRSPSNCGGGALRLQLHKLQLSGAVANTISNGQPVVFAVVLQNDEQFLTSEGALPACDVTGATVTLKTPDAQGNPTVTTILANNLSIPSGTAPFYAGMITSIVDTASGVAVARVTASVTAVLHDVTIPDCTPDGTSAPNDCDPDSAFAQQSASVLIKRPAMNISAQCLSATNTGDAVSFELAGSVTNSGDELLVNVSILKEGPGGPTVLTNINHIPVGASVSFYANTTSTNYFYPVLSNRVIAAATGVGTLRSMTAEDACSIPIAARFAVQTPVRRSDGSMELVVDCPYGWNYSIEASTNLLDWVTLGSKVGLSSATSYIDVDAPKFQARFYRAKASGL